MTKLESAYFDLSRIVAAMFVLVGHIVLLWPQTLPLKDWGHYAVDAFFVLSGYVISYVADTKERDAKTYFVSRAARIYSVAIAAILITIICDAIGRHFGDPALYERYHSDWAGLRIGAALTFTSEMWFLSIQPFSDGPYWSLCYEVWYYLIFAAAAYGRNTRKWLVVSAFALVAGPKILSMLPIWLMGVGIYHFRKVLPPVQACTLFWGSLGAIVILLHGNFPAATSAAMRTLLGVRYYRLFEYAQNFPADYIIGGLFALNYVSVRGLSQIISLPTRLSAAIKGAAASTFSIYLYHYPILLLWISLARPTALNAILGIALVTVLCVVLSLFTEQKRHLWRSAFAAMLANRHTSVAS